MKAAIGPRPMANVRYGYRRAHIQLCREGWEINHKKVYRVYSELGMQMRNSEGRARHRFERRPERRSGA